MSLSTSHLEMHTSSTSKLFLSCITSLHSSATPRLSAPSYSLPSVNSYQIFPLTHFKLGFIFLIPLSIRLHLHCRSIGRLCEAQHLASLDTSWGAITSFLLLILPTYYYSSTSSLPHYYQIQLSSHSIYICYLGTYHLAWPTQSFQSLLLQLHYLH